MRGLGWVFVLATFGLPALVQAQATAGRSAPGSTDSPDGGMRRIEHLVLETGETSLSAPVIDSAAGYLYVGTGTTPGKIIKIKLARGDEPMQRLGALTLSSGENSVVAGVIDPANGHAYFATFGSPARVVKVNLGAGDALPTRVGAALLTASETQPSDAVVDLLRGYMYVVSYQNDRVSKVQLGSGSAAPSRVGGFNMSFPDEPVIDAANGYLYVTTATSPGRGLEKVSVGNGSSAPLRLGSTPFPTPDIFADALIDVSNRRVFVTDIGHITAGMTVFGISADASLPTLVGNIVSQSTNQRAGVLNMDAAIGYFAHGTTSAAITKYRLGVGTELPEAAGSLSLPNGDFSLGAAALDSVTGNAYYTKSDSNEGRIIRVALSQKGFIHGIPAAIRGGTVTQMRFYSHAASGNLRFGIYDDAEPRQLLWQSEATANPSAETEITVPIAAGTPDSLDLPEGRYWLVWQTDSMAEVGSYAAGVANQGFSALHPFGPFPEELPATTRTSNSTLWTQYVVYTAPPAEAAWWATQ